jgi:hypothetical protein
VHWLHGFGDDTRVQETALSIIAQGFPASNRNPVVNNL